MNAPSLAPAQIAWAIAACVILPRTARADELTIVVRAYGSWDAAIAALRVNTGSEGETLQVGVSFNYGARLSCRQYQLALDENAARAFRIGSCDPSSNETSVVLAGRTELFDHDGPVPRPRTVAITAMETVRGTAVATGALAGGSAVQCGVAVRPYLDDLEHGSRVMLTPDRYAMRVQDASVVATPTAIGWSLNASTHSTLHVEYDVVDRATNLVVLHQSSTLTCGSESASADPDAPPAWLRDHARVQVEWEGEWLSAEVLEMFPDRTARIRYSGYNEEVVPWTRVRRQQDAPRPRLDPPAAGATNVRIEAEFPTESIGDQLRVNGVECSLPCDLQLSGRNRLALGHYEHNRHSGTWAETSHANLDVTGDAMRVTLSPAEMDRRRQRYLSMGVIGMVLMPTALVGALGVISGVATNDNGWTAAGLVVIAVSTVGDALFATGYTAYTHASPIMTAGARVAHADGPRLEAVGFAPLQGGVAAGATIRF